RSLQDVREGRLLSGLMLYALLTSYLEVCMSAAAVLAELAPSATPRTDTHAWYVRAMKLADLLATEDCSLQLYSLLEPHDLESLVMGINAAAMALLAIDPHMNMD
ncbi:hypothetical protein B484DRAFT_405992, partial [Ochromonadaceae sp. CCMP2298]